MNVNKNVELFFIILEREAKLKEQQIFNAVEQLSRFVKDICYLSIVCSLNTIKVSAVIIFYLGQFTIAVV